jgi:hypothetical protein
MWVGVAFIAVTYLLSGLVHHKLLSTLIEFILGLFERVGDACLIAAVLGLVVDQTLKTRLIREVVEAASPELIGQHLPSSVRTSLLNGFKINFVRPEWQIEYDVSLIEDLPDFVQVVSRVQGVIENCDSEEHEYEFFGNIDPAPDQVAPRDCLITYASVKPENQQTGFEVKDPDNSALVQPDGSKEIKTRVAIPSKARYRTVLETVEYRPRSSVMPLFTATTVVKCLVSIRYPKKVLDVHVSTGTSESFREDPTPWGGRWEILFPILPGQCIVTIWKPRALSNPPSNTVSSSGSTTSSQLKSDLTKNPTDAVQSGHQ